MLQFRRNELTNHKDCLDQALGSVCNDRSIALGHLLTIRKTRREGLVHSCYRRVLFHAFVARELANDSPKVRNASGIGIPGRHSCVRRIGGPALNKSDIQKSGCYLEGTWRKFRPAERPKYAFHEAVLRFC